MGELIDSKVVPEAGVVTRDMPEVFRDEVMDTHCPTRTIGVDLTAPFGDAQGPSISSLLIP